MAAPLSGMLVAAALLGGVAHSPAATAKTISPGLLALVDSLEASEDLSWEIPFALANPTGVGVYADSLECRIESLDPGETREGRVSTIKLPGASKLIAPVSAGDTARFQYVLRASAERARLGFKLFVHQPGGPPLALESTILAIPGPLSLRCPSRFLTVSGKRVEYVLVLPEGVPQAPGLLLIHGHGSNARLLFLSRALALSKRGYAVMTASLPGYGQSDGPPDFAGPASQQAMKAALDALRRTPGVDSTRAGVWGVSRGAGVAADLAGQSRDLRCAVVQSGIYDLWAAYRGAPADLREAIVSECGRDSAAWRARSPLLEAAKVKAPVLILHGEADPRAPAAQAHAFHQALLKAGAPAEAKFFPGAGHALLDREADRAAVEFLARQLAH